MARTEAALVTALLRSDFHSFLRKCFETLHPGTLFQDNWHLRVLAGELERLGRGETTRLIINLPPRSLKSIATSVAFVAWFLGHRPSAAVICASYGADLAEKLAFDCRKIMTSRWYEAVFATRVDRRKSAVGDFYTVQGGARLATSVGGALTGRGGDLVVIDDPAKPDEMLSDVQRDGVNRWFKSTLSLARSRGLISTYSPVELANSMTRMRMNRRMVRFLLPGIPTRQTCVTAQSSPTDLRYTAKS